MDGGREREREREGERESQDLCEKFVAHRASILGLFCLYTRSLLPLY